MRIDHSAKKFLTARLAGAVGHARIVGEDRADSCEQRIGCVAEPLDSFARGLACYPSRAAGSCRDLAIEREGGFQCDEGQAGANPFGEIFVSLLRIRQGLF